MNGEISPQVKRSSWKNWISLSGLVLAGLGLFAFALLLAIAYFSDDESPYLGIMTYMVSPGILFFGLFISLVGFLIQRRQIRRTVPGALPPVLTIDLSRPRDRKILISFLGVSFVLLMVTSVGSYQTYHVTKSVAFCATACHDVMTPQYVAYTNSPHARVECTACHIGPGAVNTLKAKFNGLHQVYSVVMGKVERPVGGHDKIKINQKTCEQCHWPNRFVGNLDRTFIHALDDTNNTPYAVRLSLKVGGGDPTHGPVGGIHWHMNVGNKVEYIATDKMKQKIPWVRFTNNKGEVTEFRTADFKDDISKHQIHTMDCMDCHSRPAHHFRSPNDAVDLAIASKRISPKLPSIKKTAVLALTEPSKTSQEGLLKISGTLRKKYPPSPELDASISEIQHIYSICFFPEMKTDWRFRPNNIGHKDSPGCFRCHDNEHLSADKKLRVGNKDCNQCHTILGEGKGVELDKLDSTGLKFTHPEDGWDALNCYDCHNGTMDSKS